MNFTIYLQNDKQINIFDVITYVFS